MNRERKIKQTTALFCAAGFCLLGFAVFAPDPGQHPGFGFIRAVRQTSWYQPLEWEAAWCSVKIILFCLGLCLLIESLGTWFMKIGHVLLGVCIYLLHIVPLLGLLAGTYYLVKSLL